jgi:hypothetical protein
VLLLLCFWCRATQEWHIFGISTSNWRLRVLAPMNELRAAPLDHILMAVTGVSGGGGGGTNMGVDTHH